MPVLSQRFRESVLERLGDRNQSDLARTMGVHRVYVSRYLTGRHSPGLDVIERFADALGCDPVELLRPLDDDRPRGGRSSAPPRRTSRRKVAV